VHDSGLEDTLEFPAPVGFWKKWELWIVGSSLVFILVLGTIVGVLTVSACCASTGQIVGPPIPAPQPAPAPIVLPPKKSAVPRSGKTFS
jgi:hypothetical protein